MHRKNCYKPACYTNPNIFRFLSHIFASKNQIPVVAITMPNGKIPSKDTRTDPIICSSTIINHILLGFKKTFLTFLFLHMGWYSCYFSINLIPVLLIFIFLSLYKRPIARLNSFLLMPNSLRISSGADLS